MMAYVESWWASNGTTFLLGATGLLTLAITLAMLIRSEVGQQRCCEAAVGAVMLWLVLSPLPSFLPHTAEVLASLAITSAPRVVESNEASISGISAISGFAWARIILLAGFCSLILYLGCASLLLARLLHCARPAGKEIEGILKTLPLYQPSVSVLISEHAQRPFCCGIFRPRIILPTSSAGLPTQTLRAVLMHELAHLSQRDLRGRVLFALAMPVLFWNPMYWWLRMRAQLCAELVADDLAASHLDKREYVRDLIALAEHLPTSKLRGPVRMAVFEKESEFYRRMKMLMERRDKITAKCSFAQTVIRRAGMLSLVALAACAWNKVPEPDDRIVQRIEVASEEDAPRVYFAFENADASKVFDSIAKISGINLIISPEATGKVNIRMKNEPWQNALIEVAEQVDCVVMREAAGIYRITPRSE